MSEKEKNKVDDEPAGFDAELPFVDQSYFPSTEETRAILSLPVKERLEFILNAPDSRELVAQLPETDLFLTVKGLGIKESLDLISLATPEQIIHLLDLDLWKKDQLNQENGIVWLETLEACGEEKLKELFDTLDSELLVALFQKLIRVVKMESLDDEIGESLDHNGFTLDGYYYVQFLSKQDAPLITRFLKFLSTDDPLYYQNFLEWVHLRLPMEEEETALQWRRGRLADRGFPEFYEALEIYQYVPSEQVREGEFPERSLPEASFYPPSHLESAGEGTFLYAALNRGLEEGELPRIKWELAHLANQILVADGAELNEPAPIYQSVQKAFQFLDLGLRHLSRDDLGTAGEILRRIPLLRVFQTGYSLGLDLKYRAEAIIRRGEWYRDILQREEVLDSPFKETIRGLFFKRPLYYDRSGGGNYRPFQDLRELEEIGALLDNLAELGRLISQRLGVPAGEINNLSTFSLFQPDPSLGAVCLTVLANRMLSGRAVLRPLTVDDWERVKDLLFEQNPEGGFTPGGPKFFQQAYHLFAEKGPKLSPREEEALRWWLDILINQLEGELGRIPVRGKADPRFISGFIIRRPKSH
jgi:Family of unknown function (DUF6178)